MTLAAFQQQMDRMAGLRFVPADFGGHFEAVQDAEPSDLAEAIRRELFTGAGEFPTPPALRAAVQAVASERLAASVVDEAERTIPLAEPVTIHVPQAGRDFTITHEHQYQCHVCQDAGFEEFACDPVTAARYPWLRQRTCERDGAHGPHTYVRYCLCYKNNSVVQARLTSGRR